MSVTIACIFSVVLICALCCAAYVEINDGDAGPFWLFIGVAFCVALGCLK